MFTWKQLNVCGYLISEVLIKAGTPDKEITLQIP